VASLTHADLLTRIANRLRIPASNTTETAKLTALMNDAYRSIAMAHPTWWWLLDRQVVNTTAEVTTGTVAATNGSTSITFSDAPAASVAGAKIVVTGNTDDPAVAYRISAHTAAQTGATLDAAYTGTTVTESAFHVWTDEYSVAADTNRIVSILQGPATLREVGWREMDELKARDNARSGAPEFWSLRNFATSGDPTTQRRLVLHPYPDQSYRLEATYVQSLNTEVSSTTRFLIPDDYVDVLLHATLADGYPIFLNDTQRGLYHRQKADALLGRMIATQRTYEDAPAIQPAVAGYRSFYRRTSRMTPANVSLGQSAFARWPYVP
jgi:hypothetical protein